MTDRDERFEWFFRSEYEAVLRSVTLVTRDRARAEEVTQEAFTTTLVHWRRVSRYEHPDAWVRRVAIRLAIRVSRRERLRTAIERRREPSPGGPTEPDPSLAEAIAALPPAQRAAVVLFYYEDRPTSEIATILDCSEATARVHLHKARKRLATTMNRELDDVT